MSTHFASALAYTLSNEGLTFVDDPADSGGPTRYGITQGTLSSYWGRAATRDEVANLDKATAAAIYQALYWQPLGLEALDVTVATLLFDTAVLCGTNRAVRLAQRALGLPVDGMLGPITRAELTRTSALHFTVRVVPILIDYFVAVIRYTPAKNKFFEGWVRRALKGLSLVDVEALPANVPPEMLASR